MQLTPTVHEFSRIKLAVAALLLTLVVAGCGDGSSGGGGGAGATGASSSLASGTAHGAFGPIVGATVTAYKAGITGFGTGAVAITSAITNNTGAFTFTSGTCNTGDAIYYVSRGGNAGGGVNPAIALMSEVGLCESLPATVVINEVTTVASVYALAQFIGKTSPYPVGTSATNIIGQKNAFANAGNLVNVTNGIARSTTPAGATAPQRNVNTIANALISCVNSSAGSAFCAELFDCAKPGAIFDGGASCTGGTGTTPTDTLGATINMALSPAKVSVAGIFDSSTIRPIFQPALAAVPDSLVLVISNIAVGEAIDAAGNHWLTNFSAGSVTKLTSNGAVIGTYNNINTPGANFSGPYVVAIDAAGNVWVTNFFGRSLTKLTSSGGLLGFFNNVNTPGANFIDSEGIAVDASNNVWVVNNDPGSVTKVTASGALIGNFDRFNVGPRGIAIDSAANAWIANGASSVTKLASNGSVAGNFDNSNTPGADFAQGLHLAIDAADNVWVVNNSPLFGSSVTKLNSSGVAFGNFNNTNTPGANFPTEASGGALGSPAIDGAGNVWLPSTGDLGSGFAVGAGVIELTSSGKLVADLAFGGAGGDPMIDASGDVWMSSNEMVGAARPVRTPLVACLKLSPPHAVCLP